MSRFHYEINRLDENDSILESVGTYNSWEQLVGFVFGVKKIFDEWLEDKKDIKPQELPQGEKNTIVILSLIEELSNDERIDLVTRINEDYIDAST